MPVASKDTPVMLAAFGVDPGRAAALLPGQELHPLRIWNRGVLMMTVANYRETVIGPYVEFFIGILCTRGWTAAPRFLPLLLQKRYGTGLYIYDLPVSTEISVKGGKSIWGMPKRRASLDFVVEDDIVSSQYDLEGQLMVRLDISRPRKAWLPVNSGGVGYGSFRGMMTKSYIYVKGRLGFAFGGRASGRLLLGNHPRMRRLVDLDIDPQPFLTGYFPRTEGVLDDHIETWFLTHGTMPDEPAEGMRSVIDLGLGREWPDPPDRERSDRLMDELDG